MGFRGEGMTVLRCGWQGRTGGRLEVMVRFDFFDTGSPAAAAWPGEDDLGASGGLLPESPLGTGYKPEEVLNLNRLPNELLQEVLRLPKHACLHCRPVCRRWRDVVDGWDLWPSILPWKHLELWPVNCTCLPPADAPFGLLGNQLLLQSIDP